MEIDHTSSAAATRLRFPLLDVTRIVAAFAVVLFHWGFLYGVENPATGNHPWPILYPWSQYGYLGVQLFFMISGFLVLQSAYSKSVGGFVRARLVRLYPAYIACCTLTYVVIATIPDEPKSFVTFLNNLTMFNGVVASFTGTDPDYLDGSYWTLVFEWKFYVLVALAVAGRQLVHIERLLWIWLALTVGNYLHPTSLVELIAVAPWSSYFIAGCVFFRVANLGWNPSRAGLTVISFACALVQAALEAERLTVMHGTEFHRAICMASVAAFFALFLLLPKTNRWTILRASKWPALLGALSYPIYLLHLRLGASAVRAFWAPETRTIVLVAMLCVLVAVAYAVHRLVERPIWRLFRRPDPESNPMTARQTGQ